MASRDRRGHRFDRRAVNSQLVTTLRADIKACEQQVARLERKMTALNSAIVDLRARLRS